MKTFEELVTAYEGDALRLATRAVETRDEALRLRAGIGKIVKGIREAHPGYPLLTGDSPILCITCTEFGDNWEDIPYPCDWAKMADNLEALL